MAQNPARTGERRRRAANDRARASTPPRRGAHVHGQTSQQHDPGAGHAYRAWHSSEAGCWTVRGMILLKDLSLFANIKVRKPAP